MRSQLTEGLQIVTLIGDTNEIGRAPWQENAADRKASPMNVRTDSATDKRSREPFVMVPHSVLDAKVSGNALAVWLAIARHADAEGVAYPSRTRLAELTGLSKRVVIEKTAELQAAGLLVVDQTTKESGVTGPNVYRIGRGTIQNPRVTKSNGRITKSNRESYESSPGEGYESSPELYPERTRSTEQEPKNKSNASALSPGLTSKTSAEAIQIPAPIDTPEFRIAWESFLGHRRELGKLYTAQAAELQLASLAALGSERATAAVTHSVRNGYCGIFEPTPSRTPSQSRFDPIMPDFAEAD